MPKSVHYKKTEDGKHEVTIDGVGTPFDSESRLGNQAMFSQRPIDYLPSLPERISFNVDYEKGTCTLVTSRELKLSELAAAINQVAAARRDIPFWAELEARDFERAADYLSDRYLVEKLEGGPPSNLAWFWISPRESFSVPFGTKDWPIAGRLHVVPTTRTIGRELRYAIRVQNENGKVVWEDHSLVFGMSRMAVADSDGDGAHEIYLHCYGLGGEKQFHIIPAVKQPPPPAGDKSEK